MKNKNIWTNYKIYAFLLGIIIGTFVYNLLGIDFSCVKISKVKGNDFLNSLTYFCMINMKFWIVIFLLSFLKFKDKILFCIILMEAFLLAGFISITIIIGSTVILYEIPMIIFKMVCALILYSESRPIFHKLISLLILIVGTVVENIFFVFL